MKKKNHDQIVKTTKNKDISLIQRELTGAISQIEWLVWFVSYDYCEFERFDVILNASELERRSVDNSHDGHINAPFNAEITNLIEID